MGRKFDPSRMTVTGDVWGSATYYYKDEFGGEFRASRSQIKKYKAWLAKTNPKEYGGLVDSKGKKYLKMQSKWEKPLGGKERYIRGKNNWARPLALRGGVNPELAGQRAGYYDAKGAFRKGSNKIWYHSTLDKASTKGLARTQIGKKSVLKGSVINGSKEWVVHLGIVQHMLRLNAERFRVAVGHRAIVVFQESFDHEKFNSIRGVKWRPLSPNTVRKRQKRKTMRSSPFILNELGDLKRSIKLKENDEPFTTQVYTDEVPAHKHKKISVCYAGFHNDPKPYHRYGRSGVKYIRRQFMGYSEKITNFAFEIMDNYLFHSVFLFSMKNPHQHFKKL